MALTGAPERWIAPIACKLSCRRRKVVQCHRLQEDANGQTVSRRSVLSEGLLMRTVLMTWYHGRESIISTLRRTTVYDYVHAFSPKPRGVTPRQLSITSSKHPDYVSYQHLAYHSPGSAPQTAFDWRHAVSRADQWASSPVQSLTLHLLC